MTRRALTVLVVLVGIVVWSSGPSFASAPAAFGYDDIELVADPARLLALPTTTGVAQVAHAYDVSTVASVDDRTSAAAETASALLNGVRDESVSLPIYDPGPSTTSSRSVVATNTVDDVGLSARGVVPAAGTRVRPAGVPDEWRVVPTNSGGGVRYYDPTNPGNSVRVMQGSPTSPYPNSQAPYVRWQRNGAPLDANGNVLPTANVPAAHIPLQDFRFLPEVFAG